MKTRSLCFLLLLLSVLFSCTNGEQMRLQLGELERQNRADSLMTNDSLALTLADYFDRHGTPNEQMRAHYILGRTYYDLDRQPEALNAYQDAADCADTTAQDCDYYTLCRVHAQMGDLFYWQQQFQRQLEELRKSYVYAMRAQDTLVALYNYGMRGNIYDALNQCDSAIVVYENLINELDHLGYHDYATMYCGLLVHPLVIKGEYAKAKDNINRYETLYPDDSIPQSGKIYFHIKALYYFGVQKYDSTEYYLRKLQNESQELNDRIAVAKGLTLFYERKANPDSLTKYARMAYDLQDTLVSHIEADNILHFDKMYQYERLQAKIQKKTKETEQARKVVWALVSLSILLLAICAYAITAFRQKKRQALEQYIKDQEELERLQEIIKELSIEKHGAEADAKKYEELCNTIEDAQTEILNLKKRISNYERRTRTKDKTVKEQHFMETPIYKKLRSIIDKPISYPSEDDWTELVTTFNQEVPNFYIAIHQKVSVLSDTEYRICMLTWLRFAPSDMCNLIGISKVHVSILRKRLLKKIFGKEGSTKEFDAKIGEIC